MTVELWALVASAAWCLCLVAPITLGRIMTPGGLQWGIGNREEGMTFPSWVKRAERAHLNTVENLAPFTALILGIHLSGSSDALTEGAALSFVGARVLHSLFYLAGWVPLRTIAFVVSLVAMTLLFLALFL